MKLFLIIFSLALLFVIGSAGMMRYFDNKHVPKKDIDKKPNAKKMTDESGSKS